MAATNITVTTPSGLTLILEDAGEDSDGNRLWRQIKAGRMTSCWPTIPKENE